MKQSASLKGKAVLGGRAIGVIRRKNGLVEHFDDGNIVVDVGIDYILNGAFGEASQITAWYGGLLNNYTPVAGSTMTNFGAQEFTAYDEATRQAWTPNAASSAKQLTNSSSPMTFTCSTNSSTVYGMFLSSSSTKSGTAGTAISGILFASPKSLDDGDEIDIVYVFGGADDGV